MTTTGTSDSRDEVARLRAALADKRINMVQYRKAVAALPPSADAATNEHLVAVRARVREDKAARARAREARKRPPVIGQD